MNTLVISDIHLTDAFEENLYMVMARLITTHDRIIINGDFWDGYRCSFSRFVESEWNALFPLLKHRGTVYIHGNHDRMTWTDERVYEFCDLECTGYELVEESTVYRFEHGHKLTKWGTKLFHQKPPSAYGYPIHQLTHTAQKMLLKVGNGAVYGFIPRTIHRKRMVKHALGTTNRNTILVIGHTHDPFCEAEHRIVNSGFAFGGYVHYVTISAQGPELKHERY